MEGRVLWLDGYEVEAAFISEPYGGYWWGGYWWVWLPCFGRSACSATGDTLEEALRVLKRVKDKVIQHYQFRNIDFETSMGNALAAGERDREAAETSAGFGSGSIDPGVRFR